MPRTADQKTQDMAYRLIQAKLNIPSSADVAHDMAKHMEILETCHRQARTLRTLQQICEECGEAMSENPDIEKIDLIFRQEKGGGLLDSLDIEEGDLEDGIPAGWDADIHNAVVPHLRAEIQFKGGILVTVSSLTSETELATIENDNGGPYVAVLTRSTQAWNIGPIMAGIHGNGEGPDIETASDSITGLYETISNHDFFGKELDHEMRLRNARMHRDDQSFAVTLTPGKHQLHDILEGSVLETVKPMWQGAQKKSRTTGP